MKKILILNGPNLNLLGSREPDLYGNRDFESYFQELKRAFPDIFLDYFQSNHEGVLIDVLHSSEKIYDAVIFNPGAYTHTSVALADAIRSIKIPVAEVHITDITQREEYRRISYVKESVEFSVMGKGLEGYSEAVQMMLKKILK